jgi:vitamin K-dependent gamma-carboxylase
VLRFIQYDRIRRYYVEPEFLFTYPGFGWVRPLPEPWIHVAWGLVGVCGLLVMLGLFYRAAIVGATTLFTYFFLLDKAQYLNHFYMVILYAALLCAMPANRMLALDARRRPGLRSETIPYWPVFLLRAQTEIILVYAGLVKLSEDWLKGEPLGIWLRAQADEVPFGAIFAYDWVILAGAWGAVALHLVGAPLLLWPRTRLPVFLIYCVFHSANAYFFNIGIFPWLTIAVTLVFFPPDWPQRALRWLLGRFEPLPPRRVAAAPPMVPISTAVLAAIAFWLALQVAVPLRFAAFPGEVRWTGDGHRFAWRMRLYDRATQGHFTVRDLATGQTWFVDPEQFLTPRQAGTMLGRPDMIHQFARHLEAVWAADGYGDVAVHALVEKSLNGRPAQPYIDPEADLTAHDLRQLASDPWVVPLRTALQ